MMVPNEIRASTDHDFDNFYSLVSGREGWTALYNKTNVKVEAKWTEVSRIKMLKVSNTLDGVSLDCLYDVLNDPEYRKVWDKDMADTYDICKVSDNSIISWYGAKMPAPLKYRDWCTLRTFRKSQDEFMIFNHSVEHKRAPVRKNYIRSISYITGYYAKFVSPTSCRVVFLTQTDPKGKLPSWFVNYLSCKLSPRVMKKLHKTAMAYDKWKEKNSPEVKPWLTPEQNSLPLLDPSDVTAVHGKLDDVVVEEIDESNVVCENGEGTDGMEKLND